MKTAVAAVVVAFGLAATCGTALAQSAGQVTGWLSIEPGTSTFQDCKSKSVIALWPPDAADTLIAQAKRERRFYPRGSMGFVYATVNLSFIDAGRGRACTAGLQQVFRCANLVGPFVLHRRVDVDTCAAT